MQTLLTIEVIDRLGSVESDYLLTWCKSQNLRPEVYKKRLSGRDCCWWGREITDYGLFSVGWQEAPIFPPKLEDLKQRFYPEANSCLLYRYEKGKGINIHFDKGCKPKVVLINLMDMPRNLFGIKDESIRFKWGMMTNHLKDGDVVAFDSSQEHSVYPVPCERYSLQFRVVN